MRETYRSMARAVKVLYLMYRLGVATDISVPIDITESPMRIEHFLEGLTETERGLVIGTSKINQRHAPIPELRATLFPLMEFLYLPFRWAFSLIESLLLLAVWIIHKLFSWLAAAFWFIFQLVIYNTIEGFLKSFLYRIDLEVVAMMPDWASGVSMAGITYAVMISGLKSYWYGMSFWESLKWIAIARVGLWCLLQAVRGAFVLRQHVMTVRRRDF
jgi:hypothetical protein